MTTGIAGSLYGLSIALGLGIATALVPLPADAAPPTDAQIDRLLDALRAREMIDTTWSQVEEGMRTSALASLDAHATPEQRAEVERAVAEEVRTMRQALSWERLAPVYRLVYRETLTAEEVDAALAFFGSEHGRSMMQKLPSLTQKTMQILQPMLLEEAQRRRELLQQRLRATDDDAR
jgi:hypothetical protein